MKTKFISFLKEHKCLSRYMNNLETREYEGTPTHFLQTASDEDFISKAFCWDKDNYDFWSELNDMWINKVKYAV